MRPNETVSEQRGGEASDVGESIRGGVAMAASDSDKCQAAKNKIAGKYAFCRQKSVAKGIKKGLPPDFSKCVEKFDDKWGKTELKFGTECPTLGDGADIKQRVENCMLGVASILDCVNVAGSCWYFGQDGASCTATCASLGLVVDPATSTFAGASPANCNAVLDALGDGNPAVVASGPCLVGLGCHVFGGTTRTLCDVSSDGAALAGYERVCACQ
jgi:hypothetical protein